MRHASWQSVKVELAATVGGRANHPATVMAPMMPIPTARCLGDYMDHGPHILPRVVLSLSIRIHFLPPPSSVDFLTHAITSSGKNLIVRPSIRTTPGIIPLRA
jgi:hypothetical protein